MVCSELHSERRKESGEFVGLIGYPVAHSISPVIQQVAFDYHCLATTYEAWEVQSDCLEQAVKNLRQPSHLGANVTVPYKEAVMRWLDGVDEDAQVIGAVNTIVRSGRRLTGHNTDAGGFLKALNEDARFDPFHLKVVVLGAGGAARAVLAALIDAEAASIVVINRDVARAKKLLADMAGYAGESSLSALSIADANLGVALEECDLLVNATPIGMKHGPPDDECVLPIGSIKKDTLVMDLVYNPTETRLLKQAQGRGCQTLNGLPMLVYQAALSFELWTGKKAPVGLMFAKAREELRRRGA